MKLANVFAATSVWATVAKMKLSPRVAYNVLKYAKLVSAEHDIIEQQRVALIRELTGTQDGQEAKIEPGTKELKKYVERFGAILETECDLKQFDMSMDEFLLELEVSPGHDNEITAQELGALEPFFRV